MSITAGDTTLTKILYIDDNYSIPKNQRKYVWGTEQVNILLDDIFYNMDCTENGNDYHHFIGNFIFQEEKNGYKIVDGQQRLTTLTLIFSVIIKLMKKYGKVRYAENIIPYVASKDNEIPDLFNMRIENVDYKIYSMIIHDFCLMESFEFNLNKFFEDKKRPIKKDEKHFVENTELIITRILEKLETIDDVDAKTKWLNRLIETLKLLTCIKIDSTEHQEGCIIFETLNSRGIPLEQYELIKNYIFMYSKKTSDAYLPEEKWNRIEKYVDDIRHSEFKQFISHYITHKYGKIAAKEEYIHIKRNVKPLQVSELLDDLLLKAEYYNYICMPEDSELSKSTKYVLNFFNSNNIRQLRPILISLINAYKSGYISGSEMDKVFIKLKNFVSIYFSVCQNKANALESIIYKYALELENNFSKQVLYELIDSLKSQLPNKEVFIEIFCEVGYTNHKVLYPNLIKSTKTRAQHIIREHEIYLSEIDDYTCSSFTIEHIKNDSDGGNACYIGNLIPLVGRRNKNLKNKDVSDKLETYKCSCFLTAQQFVKYYKDKEWNDATIKERSARLAEKFYTEIWKV